MFWKRVWGDTFVFAATTFRAIAVGFEVLEDGFVLFLGPMCIGWASVSSFWRRENERRAALAEVAAMLKEEGDLPPMPDHRPEDKPD